MEYRVPVYLAPWTACSPGDKPTANCPRISYPLPCLSSSPGGQAVQAGLSCPLSPPPTPARTGKILLCDVYYYLQQFNNYMQFLSYKYVNLRWLLQTFSWVSYWQGVRGQAVQSGLSCPPPRISKRIDNQQVLLHHLLQEYFVEKDINFISVNLRCLHQMFSWVTYWQGVGGWGGGGQAVQGGLSWPLPRISDRMDNPQIFLHHLLQEYLVERDKNFISVNLRCLLQTFSWVTYWQGVGGKLSRAVYLAPSPHPEFQKEWIIRQFYDTIYYRNI